MKRRDFLTTALTLTAATTFPEHRVLGAEPLPAVGNKGEKVSLSETAVRDFQKNIRGSVVLPSSPDYETARRIWNGAFDKRPSMVVRAADVNDVISAVQFARTNNILVAVRGGGHSYSGQSTTDGGMVIDTGAMQAVEVDPGSKRARVQGGALLGNLDKAAAPHKLAVTAGFVSHTGVGGLALGGGHGRLQRKFGLTLDNNMGVDIVTAEGKLLRATATENPDLYWAVRGGGGNFGIVTNFEFQLHDMDPEITTFAYTFPIENAVDAINFFWEYNETAPDELSGSVGLRRGPDGVATVSIGGTFIGTPAQAEGLLAPVAKFGKPINARIGKANYVFLQGAADRAYPHGRHYYSRAGMFNKVGPDLSKAMVDFFVKNPRNGASISAAAFGGAAGRVPENATAYAHRDALYQIGCSADWDDPVVGKEWLAYCRAAWAAISPLSGAGFYVNTASDEGDAEIRKNYRGNYDRLVQVKTKYDPTNFFHLNGNIKPKQA